MSARAAQPLSRVWIWAAVIPVAGVLGVLGMTLAPALYGVNFFLALLLSVAQSGSIVLALIRPRLAGAIHIVAAIGIALDATRTPWPWPAPAVSIIALSALLVVLALVSPWWISAATWALTSVGLTLLASDAGSIESGWLANLIVTASVSGAVLALGLLLRQWLSTRADLGIAKQVAEQQLQARQWAEERARIAREMHDVVAHSMSIVQMRATSAKYRIPDLPSTAIEEFDGIAAQARKALGQMRGVLGVLRGDDAAQLAPQPGLAQLQDLIDGARGADLEITASIEQLDPPPSEAVQLALYRVAQEAIANVVRHAPGASTTLRLEADDRITLSIASFGGAATAAPDRGGHGIRGMMERMNAIGGSLTAMPISDGFEVTASVPRER